MRGEGEGEWTGDVLTGAEEVTEGDAEDVAGGRGDEGSGEARGGDDGEAGGGILTFSLLLPISYFSFLFFTFSSLYYPLLCYYFPNYLPNPRYLPLSMPLPRFPLP